MTEAMSMDERLARAANTADLTATPERNADALTLIAAGKTPRVVGRHLIALYGEWDSCAKPRRLLQHDIDALVDLMPAPPMALVYSHRVLDRWATFEAEDRRARAVEMLTNEWARAVKLAFERLRSLPRVEAGLCDILQGRIKDPERKVRAVLSWWLSRVCATCNGTRYQLVSGTKKLSERACPTCFGTGEVALPHGADGRIIERAIDDCIERAKRDIGNFRHRLRQSTR